MATMDPGQRRSATKRDAFKKAIASGVFKPPKKIAPRIPRGKGKLPWPPPPGARRKPPRGGLKKLPYPLPKRKK